MPCDNCGGALSITKQSGGTNGGSFIEVYECANCGQTGTISGESSNPPQRWDKSGSVFGEP